MPGYTHIGGLCFYFVLEMETNPYNLRYNAVLTWLLVVKYDSFIRRCVNRDVARKIANLIKVNLGSGKVCIDGKWLSFVQGVACNWTGDIVGKQFTLFMFPLRGLCFCRETMS